MSHARAPTPLNGDTHAGRYVTSPLYSAACCLRFVSDPPMNTRRVVLTGVGATLVAGVIPALAIAWTPQRWEGRDYMQCMCTPAAGGGMWAAYPAKDDTPENRVQTEDFLRREVSR